MRLAQEAAEEIAALLARRAGSDDVAFLRWNDTLYFARGLDAVRTAPFVLAQAIHGTLAKDAKFIVRSTIHATREPGPFVLGVVKVAARRLRVVSPSPRVEGDLVLRGMEVRELTTEEPRPRGAPRCAPSPSATHEEWLRFAGALIAPAREDIPRYARDRRVGAALVSAEGALLAASPNTNGANRTLHAELNVLLGRWVATRALLPRGTRLYATLRPCRMCAGLLWELSEAPGTVPVYFAEDDPGSAARNTVLCPGSEMRLRFARTDEERRAPGCTSVPLA